MSIRSVLSFILAAASLACAAVIRPSADEALNSVQLSRQARQLSLSGALSSALGSGLGALPLVGGLLSPAGGLAQGPLSSGLNFLTSGLVNRDGQDFGFNPAWSQSFLGRSQPLGQYQMYQAPQPLTYILD